MSAPVLTLGATPEELLLSNLPMLRRVVRAAAQRWRLGAEDAEDLLSEVQLMLLENGYEALRSCQDPARMRAFLATTVAHHLLDRRNHEWGKWRPCAEAKRQGPDAELLDRLLNRDGLPLDEAAARLHEQGVAWGRGEIERRAALFPPRWRRRQENDEILADRPAAAESPEQALLAEELAAARLRALALVTGESTAWPAEDRLILRGWMRGQSISTLARQLDLPPRPLYRRIEAFLRRLRSHLEQNGIGHAEAKEILALDRWESEPESSNHRIVPN